MRILLVIDQYDSDNNGTTISAKRFSEKLKEHGHNVKVVSTGKKDKDKYVVDKRWFPRFAEKIIEKQGMTLAYPDEDVLRKAIGECDVVHFLMPFKLCKSGVKIAEELEKPHTAAFHVQPENITFSIGMGKVEAINRIIYKHMKNSFFNRFNHIHCPSGFIAEQLKKNGYKAKLHVISNGVDREFKYSKKEKEGNLRGKIVLLMIGRLSNEKRQDLIIDAVEKSKHKESIQLVFAGQGPNKDKLVKQGAKLKNKPIIGFYSKRQLINLISMSDLYVHSADIEIEAIACIEAFSCGLVPVISNSPKSATTQFAIDERSLFKAGDSSDLARKIDYWLDNQREKLKMERIYSKKGELYNIDSCVYKIEKMFEEAIKDNGDNN